MSPNQPFECQGIDHVVLRVTNIKKSLAFYTEILTLTLERVIEDLEIYQLRCGRNMIDLCALKDQETLTDNVGRGIDHICLNVSGDVDAMEAYLHANSVSITSGPVEVYGANGFGTSIFILDPDEYLIELKSGYAQWAVKTTVANVKRDSTRPHE